MLINFLSLDRHAKMIPPMRINNHHRHGLTKEIVYLLNELIETIRVQKFDDYRSEKYEILVAYALFQEELKFMKKHLEGKL